MMPANGSSTPSTPSSVASPPRAHAPRAARTHPPAQRPGPRGPRPPSRRRRPGRHPRPPPPFRRRLPGHAPDPGRPRPARRPQATEQDPLPLDEALPAFDEQGLDVIALHEALDRLAARASPPGPGRTLRFFGGLSVPEVAERPGDLGHPVEGDWRFARAPACATSSPEDQTP